MQQKNKDGSQNQYEFVLQQIDRDSQNISPIKAKDEYLYDAMKKVETDPEYDTRNSLYSELLSYYISSYRSKDFWKKWYKAIFFTVIMASFLCIIVFSLGSIWIISQKEDTKIADIGVMIGGFSSVLAALLIIPKIIAEHLFPSNEDAHMIDMVKNMQQNDSSIRAMLHPEKENSEKPPF